MERLLGEPHWAWVLCVALLWGCAQGSAKVTKSDSGMSMFSGSASGANIDPDVAGSFGNPGEERDTGPPQVAVDTGSDSATAMSMQPDTGTDIGSGSDAAVDTGSPVVAPGCDDLFVNGSETGTDCGGPICPPCGDGQGCALSSDCMSLACSGRVCQGSSCNDSRQNGDESDVDCGGTCMGCAPGRMCNDDGDCANGPCKSDKTCDCTALTTQTCPAELCGAVEDGCGGTVDCPDTCGAGTTCYASSCCTIKTVGDCLASECGTRDDGAGLR